MDKSSFIKSTLFQVVGLGIPAFSSAFFSGSAQAQVTPDQTLGAQPTTVRNTTQNEFVIEGGTQRATNLFHSFEQFNVGEGESVLFLSAPSVARIFSRVTGGNLSIIDGLVDVDGTADLYLINPAGITFRPNAQLAVEGSFIASTANNITFADGLVFSTELESTLLSSDLPVGLGLSGNNPITLQDEGHSLYSGNILIPFVEPFQSPGLSVPSEETLALIGGSIDFEGGIVRSPNSNVVIGAVTSGNIDISENLAFSFGDINSFGTIDLDRFSLIDTSGTNGGNIQISGGDIRLIDSSVIKLAFQEVASPQINITGQTIFLDGEISEIDPALSFERAPTTPIPFVPAAIVIDNYSSEVGGNLNLASEQVTISNGSQILTRGFGQGLPSNINVSSERLLVNGFNSLSDDFSGIIVGNQSTASPDKRAGGTVSVDSEFIELTNGGVITSSTVGRGDGGRVEINAEAIRISSSTERLRSPSQISALASQRGISPTVGNGGEVAIRTGSLELSDGAAIGTSTDTSSNAGNVRIQARDFIQIDGLGSSVIGPSRIGSDVIQLPQDFAIVVGAVGIPTGEGGSVFIATPRLQLQNGGLIAVRNEGSGGAGDLTIDSQSIFLVEGGQLSASSIQGNGGNLTITADSIFLRDGSINTAALESGDGGNVTINSDAIALLNGSTISANAEIGTGGQVMIAAETLLQSSDSQISATSGAGAAQNGRVAIQVPDEAPRTESEIQSPALQVPQVAAACTPGTRQNSEFTITGRGGLPATPTDIQQTYSGWMPDEPASNTTTTPSMPPQIVEAQGWLVNGNGTLRFTDRATNLVTAPTRQAACLAH